MDSRFCGNDKKEEGKNKKVPFQMALFYLVFKKY